MEARTKKIKPKFKRKTNFLLNRTSLSIICIIVGLSLSFVGKYFTGLDLTEKQRINLNLPVELFVHLLNLVCYGLVVTGIIEGITKAFCGYRRMLWHCFKMTAYFLTMAIVGVVSGTLVSILIRPGDWAAVERGRMEVEFVLPDENNGNQDNDELTNVLLEYVRDLVSVFPQISFTPYTSITSPLVHRNATNFFIGPIILFSGLFAISLAHMKHSRKHVHGSMESFLNVNYVIYTSLLVISDLLFNLAPFVFFVQSIDWIWGLTLEDLAGITGFLLTVCIVFAIQFAILVLTFSIVRNQMNPFKLVSKVGRSLLTAVVTGSSTAALPLAMSSLKVFPTSTGILKRCSGVKMLPRFKKNIPHHSSAFLPFSTAFNCNGRASFNVISAIFIAQLYNVELNIVDYLILMLLSILLSILSNGIPRGNTTTMNVLLGYLGIQQGAFNVMLSCNWVFIVVGGFRTVVDLFSNIVGCYVVQGCKTNKNNNRDRKKKVKLCDTGGFEEKRKLHHHEMDNAEEGEYVAIVV